jgi:hypothetical protein
MRTMTPALPKIRKRRQNAMVGQIDLQPPAMSRMRIDARVRSHGFEQFTIRMHCNRQPIDTIRQNQAQPL